MLHLIGKDSLDRVSRNLKSYYALKKNRVHRFESKVEIFHEVGPYQLKTVSDSNELKAALKLRYEVFQHELAGQRHSEGIDIDEFDMQCDHLIIIHRKTKDVVATCRLNSSAFNGAFYAQREFFMDKILGRQGHKLELGRTCLQRNFRNGFIISLLWRGIAEYMTMTRSNVLFGCASVKTQSPRQAALLHRLFEEEGRVNADLFTPPNRAHSMPEIELWINHFKRPLTAEERAEANELISPLFRTYLQAGASIGGEPAWDSEYRCIDFLTILPREELNRSLWIKFKQASGADTDSSYLS